jgi:ribosomal protein S14
VEAWPAFSKRRAAKIIRGGQRRIVVAGIDGRPRGYLRAFGVSRVRLRELAHAGYLPGVRKSGW